MVRPLSKIQESVKKFVGLLSQEGIRIEKAILYGSYAKGEARSESDIDLAVISEDFTRYEYLDRLHLLSRIAWECEGPLEVLGYTPQEAREGEGKNILWDEILNTGKVIYEAKQ